ncbi:C2H2 type zinc-finger-domain-containing protein [Podospora australis]|uniref:C2H2 type zinc-finger-domain-containing protein n=1 Tax=Podospora australis TaxID=1536484 RepID=A0AAN6WP12_9PEZI|nr:C2H2 type zinc-finger-domain-containing protein [Podospora australis]
MSESLSNSPLVRPSSPKCLSSSSDSSRIQLFVPGQCLFCPQSSASFPESVVHMQQSHGLFVPHRQHLAVDLETLFEYLHLLIFEYNECIKCGIGRATVQAVQQHMMGKGHCTLDIEDPDSEFAEFYEFSEREDQDSEVEEGEEISPGPSRRPLPTGEDSLHLPSGRIISRKSSAQSSPHPTPAQIRRRNRLSINPQLEYIPGDVNGETEEGSSSKADQGTSNTEGNTQIVLSKREKRERAVVEYQLTRLSANDRTALMHLPLSQQRALLATQHRHEEKVQTEERRRRAKIDRKGNKNLYAYWHTETPVYQCG